MAEPEQQEEQVGGHWQCRCMQRLKEADWFVESHPSGSIVVKAPHVEEGAHYRIGHPRQKRDFVDRIHTAHALAVWLNGGRRSDLLEILVRIKPNEVLLQSDIPVTAGAWTQSEDAKIMQWRLIEGLVRDEVPDV